MNYIELSDEILDCRSGTWVNKTRLHNNCENHGARPYLINPATGQMGYKFENGDYIQDPAGRKILREGTVGIWHNLVLGDRIPFEGSIQGKGTRLYFYTDFYDGSWHNNKLTGNLIFKPRYCPNLTHLNCSRNTISTLNVSTLTNLTHLYCYNNTISTLNVSTLTNLITLNCYNNTISTLNVSTLTNLITLTCNTNSMNSAMVDTVLCDMDTHGTSNGTLNISGNAAPSATGATCKTNLEGRGWTVTTD